MIKILLSGASEGKLKPTRRILMATACNRAFYAAAREVRYAMWNRIRQVNLISRVFRSHMHEPLCVNGLPTNTATVLRSGFPDSALTDCALGIYLCTPQQ